MSDDTTTRSDDQRPPRRRGRGGWLAVAAIVLVAVGLVAGGAIVTVSGISSDERVRVVASPSPSPVLPTSDSTAPSGRVTIGAGCVRALDQAQTVYAELQRLGSAAADLDFDQLDQLVRRLQAMRPTLQHNLEQCHATVHVPKQSPNPVPVTPAQGG